ncbi:11362_t:CDS:10 [Acaulospora morrowiae]|uniref:11362_t:CDS:1 n=1 Tax=Acaulospora morrowiae TaxID=94023 RepID=A0A9N9D5F5_9GLOM|nr:11362_t:CDS:10 [Acaulospora morrowiae]
MSDGRPSASASLQSSVGVTSAEELAEKYQKLFSEFSRIKAQHSVLKKAVIKEQETNAALQDECKTKERELRSSTQQLDLLTFHNQRLTKRIECLQDSGAARLSPGWLVGSAKKELEKSKVTLEVTSVELTRKIEENEKLHKELYEVNGLYTQHVNDLQAKIADLEKKTEDLQDELTRSHIASEEALNTIRQEKRELDSELDQTRAELRKTKSLMEKNEQKLREGDDMLWSEVITTLSINLGLEESQINQFNDLQEKIDEDSNVLISSFRQLQSSTRDYLKSLKEKSASSYAKGSKVKEASQIWHKNLQTFAIKLTSVHSRMSELMVEKENLVKVTENGTTKVATLEKEITRLKEELEKQKTTESDHVGNNDQQSCAGNNKVAHVPISTKMEDNSDSGDDAPLLVNGFDDVTEASNETEGISLEDQNSNSHLESKEGGSPISFEHVQESDDEDSYDNGSEVFIYEPSTIEKDNLESQRQSIKGPLHSMAPTALSTLMSDDIDTNAHINGNILALEHDIGRVTKSEDEAQQRELLIKNHYESRISQLNEQANILQMADSKSVRLLKSYDIMKSKLANSENEKLRANQEISRLQHEIAVMKEQFAEERASNSKQIETFTEFIEQKDRRIIELEQELEESFVGTSRHD